MTDSIIKFIKGTYFTKVVPVFIAAAFYAIVFSALTGMDACLVRLFLGIPCPSCGMTRAFISLFRGDIAESFAWHPLFIFVLALPFIPKIKTRYFAYLAVLFIAVYVIRMIFLFPSEEPMTLNRQAVVFRLLQQVFETHDF